MTKLETETTKIRQETSQNFELTQESLSSVLYNKDDVKKIFKLVFDNLNVSPSDKSEKGIRIKRNGNISYLNLTKINSMIDELAVKDKGQISFSSLQSDFPKLRIRSRDKKCVGITKTVLNFIQKKEEFRNYAIEEGFSKKVIDAFSFKEENQKQSTEENIITKFLIHSSMSKGNFKKSCDELNTICDGLKKRKEIYRILTKERKSILQTGENFPLKLIEMSKAISDYKKSFSKIVVNQPDYLKKDFKNLFKSLLDREKKIFNKTMRQLIKEEKAFREMSDFVKKELLEVYQELRKEQDNLPKGNENKPEKIETVEVRQNEKKMTGNVTIIFDDKTSLITIFWKGRKNGKSTIDGVEIKVIDDNQGNVDFKIYDSLKQLKDGLKKNEEGSQNFIEEFNPTNIWKVYQILTLLKNNNLKKN